MFYSGSHVRIAFRFPEDEGFSRRLLHGRTGTVIPCVLQPDDDRLCVKLDDSTTEALINPRELQEI